MDRKCKTRMMIRAFVLGILVAGACSDAPPERPVADGPQPFPAPVLPDTPSRPPLVPDPYQPSDEVRRVPARNLFFPLDSFPELPPDARASLEARGCLIPQVLPGRKPANIVSGRFAAAGQTDWAALCSSGGKTGIVIVWGGPVSCPSPLKEFPNEHAINDEEIIALSRYVDAASMSFILQHAEWYDGPLPPSRDHDGVADGIAEKASTVYFCHEGKWVELAGAD